jgi:outer membrane protein assembly factor BamD (BamD/ComL family)
VKEFEYAEKFIEKFKTSIPKAELENVLEFCYGSIAFSRGKLEEALRHFSRSNFQNFIFKVQVKRMLLKIYYYLKMYKQAEAMIDTFRHFVGREESLLPEHRDAYYQFLKLAGELMRVNESGASADRDFKISKIKTDAEKIPANPFRIKVWLLEELGMRSD